MNRMLTGVLAATAAVALTGCASSPWVSTWRAPDATPLETQGARVAAVVMIQDAATRRAAEDALAREINARGGVGVASYTLIPESNPGEEAARAAFQQANIQGVVVMRPVSVDRETYSTPVTYTGTVYGGYWGGYHTMGWGGAYGAGMTTGGEIRTDVIFTVETLVYSLRQNKLVWGGRSKTTNPERVDEFVRELANEVASELRKEGLIATPSR
jgi:hypothetical protein